MYAYGEVYVCPRSAADRPSDDVVVEADLEQAPGADGNFYIACCAEHPRFPLASVTPNAYFPHTLMHMPHSKTNLHAMLRIALMHPLH